jgi:2,4-dienoyl-CoA reductase-like NADH-dependent reductase (Old Yellow Enzyme family)
MTFPDATFLDFAAAVKKIVRVPVIAVGRLGDPAIATQAVASGKTDFVALGRTLIADPQWVAKLRREEPIRRCLACNTCINEMRGGPASVAWSTPSPAARRCLPIGSRRAASASPSSAPDPPA